MIRFPTDDLDGGWVFPDNAPNEIQDIADSYNALVEWVMANTGELERNAIEKEVLLLEIHHRAKNNL